MIDPNSLPSEDELREIRELVTHSGISLAQLTRFRTLVLRKAAEKQRNWDAEAEGFTDPQMAVYAVADLIDPEVTGEHVHVAGRDGVRCAGGDPACPLPSKEPEG